MYSIPFPRICGNCECTRITNTPRVSAVPSRRGHLQSVLRDETLRHRPFRARQATQRDADGDSSDAFCGPPDALPCAPLPGFATVLRPVLAVIASTSSARAIETFPAEVKGGICKKVKICGTGRNGATPSRPCGQRSPPTAYLCEELGICNPWYCTRERRSPVTCPGAGMSQATRPPFPKRENRAFARF